MCLTLVCGSDHLKTSGVFRQTTLRRVVFMFFRGGHLDAAILGGLQVDEKGNIANWAVPGKPLLGLGGAMDLATGAKKLVVTMMHTNRAGHSKVVKNCTLPLTAVGAVTVLITELAKFRD